MTDHQEHTKRGHALATAPEPDAKGAKLREIALRREDWGLDWYLLRAATRQEPKAERSLIEAGLAVYLPRIIYWRRTGPKKIRHERSMFGGYLFAGLDPRDQALILAEEAEGVHAVVRFSRMSNPRPLSFAMIHTLLTQEVAGEFDRTRDAHRNDPAKGDPVEIVGGKFRGFPASFVGRRDDDRVELLMHMFGRETRFVVDERNVRGLGSGEEAA